MATISIDEAVHVLPSLIRGREPVTLCDDDRLVAILLPLRDARRGEEPRSVGWKDFWKLRDAIADNLEAELATDGMTSDEYVTEALRT